MAYTDRVSIIKEIEKKRGSKVITLITGDRPGLPASISGDIMDYLYENLRHFPEKEKEKIDLFLYSRGGHSSIPWVIVSMFREATKNAHFSVLVPYKAHSAATVITIGADEIVMGERGELGPIDATITVGPYNPTEKDSPQRLPVSVEDVNGYFALLKGLDCTQPGNTMVGFQILSQNVHPLALGQVNRLVEHTKQVALKLLETRANPLSEEKNKTIVKRLSSEVFSHDHAISRREAVKYIGLEFVCNAENFEIQELMWDLYKDYEADLDLLTPFKPEVNFALDPKLNDLCLPDLKIAYTESTYASYCYMLERRFKRAKKIPPNVQINLGQIGLPPFPSLPQGINPEQFAQMVQTYLTNIATQALQQAADKAVVEFLMRLPDAGLESVDIDARWRKI